MPVFQKLRLFSAEKSLLPALAGMILFWSIFDGILSYIAPIKISEHVSSNTEMGIILGTSSVAGALFDLFLSRYLARPHYRRLYLILFLTCFAVPLFLWQASSIPVFIIAMCLWGIYYDLYGFGTTDFVSRHAAPTDSSTQFAFILSIRSIGALMAPVLAGILIADAVESRTFITMWLFLAIAFMFYVSINLASRISAKRNTLQEDTGEIQPKSTIYELRAWKRLGRLLIFPLLFIFLFNIYDSFFFSIGPLLAESFDAIAPYNGLILSAYWLPSLLIGLYVHKFTHRLGKKRTAYTGLMLAAIPITLFPLVQDPIAIGGLIFVSAIFSSLAVPAINSAFTDYINEARTYEEEIESLQDFAINMGYVFGPITAGLISDQIGFLNTFGVLGVTVILVTLALLKFSPRKIQLDNLQ